MIGLHTSDEDVGRKVRMLGSGPHFEIGELEGEHCEDYVVAEQRGRHPPGRRTTGLEVNPVLPTSEMAQSRRGSSFEHKNFPRAPGTHSLKTSNEE